MKTFTSFAQTLFNGVLKDNQPNRKKIKYLYPKKKSDGYL